MANANRALGGYPQPAGAKVESIFPHLGPASYVQITVTAGTIPVTNGDTVYATEAGMKFFDRLEAGQTDDGAFTVQAIPVTITNPSNPNSTSALSGIPSTSYKLKWISNVTATIGGQVQTAGTEAVAGTNLSAECVRCYAKGN